MNYLLAVVAFIGWAFVLDYRKQNGWLNLKNDGYKNALLGYMMYRYRDLAKIEKLEAEIERLKKCTKVCEFGRGTKI
jgi:hypothetical protein